LLGLGFGAGDVEGLGSESMTIDSGRWKVLPPEEIGGGGSGGGAATSSASVVIRTSNKK